MSLDTVLPHWEILLRLGLATLFGMVLGLDRELSGKSAGLRTHMLVALGAAVTTVAGLEMYYRLVEAHAETNADPLRTIEGVIAAIGFIGAGVILRGESGVHNLTTAANIWLCGAIGLAAGSGQYFIAITAFGFTLVILVALRVVERRIKKQVADDAPP